jgi:hypothetical protein
LSIILNCNYKTECLAQKLPKKMLADNGIRM